MIAQRPLLSLAVRFLFLFAFCLFTFSLATAQSATATLSGTVDDANGAIIPGAAITLLNDSTSLKRQTTTNDEGRFTIPLLPPGTYTLTTQRDGFATAKIPNVILNVGDQKSLQVHLNAGNISEMVQVEGDAPLINESPAVSTVVDRQFVENIPLNGRSFQSLMTTVPGVVVVPGATTGQAGEFSVNGQRTESNYYMVDGVSANTGTVAAASALGTSGDLPGETALGTTQSLVSLDALQEFRIQTSSYSAEYGRTPGGQISFITRSGTNVWHGSLFDYLRNGVFDANNWFNNAARIAKTNERQNDFGGTLSGPVLLPSLGEGRHQPGYNGRNRTFFFFSYEGLRLSTPQLARTTFVPDLCLRGVTTQCIGTDKPAPAALQPYLNAFPLPNGPANGTTGMAQFTAAFSTPGSLDATSVRIDHSFNDKFTLFGRYSDSPSRSVARLVAGSSDLSNLRTTSISVRALTIGITNSFSSRLTNEFRTNWTGNKGSLRDSLDNLGGAVPFDLTDIKDTNGQPTPGVASFILSLTFGGNGLYRLLSQKSAQSQVNVVDTVSYSLGAHSLRFGFDYRRLATPLTLAKLIEIGTFTSKTQLAAGVVPATGSQVQSQQSFPIGPVYSNLSLFVHDEWKISRRLNLSLGLRWELNPPPGDVYGNQPYTVDQITNLATSKVASKETPLWKTTHGNFAPRVGLAYQLRQTPGRETVIRGGFGVFYDLGNTFASAGYGSVGLGVQQTLGNVTFPFTSTQLTLPPPSVSPPYNAAVTAFDPHLQLPYTIEWNAAVEQAFGNSQALTVTYVGAAGRRLLVQRSLRPALFGNPNFTSTGILNLTTNRATSDYDALQAQFQRRLSSGLQALASYTWSHSIDEASVNSLSTQLLRSSSNFDVRHNLQAAVTYDVPGTYENPVAGAILRHWSLDARVTGRSALPFDVSSGTFIDATGTQQQLRADLVAGQPVYISDPIAPGGRKVNFNAFTQPTTAEKAAGQFGNAPRNFLRAFPVWQMDFAIRREFPIHERLKLQFRAQAFNIFNHPIFGAIQNNLAAGATLFGLATGTLNSQLGGLNALYQQGGPRSFQFALKIVF